jgi:hypothetical protein
VIKLTHCGKEKADQVENDAEVERLR